MQKPSGKPSTPHTALKSKKTSVSAPVAASGAARATAAKDGEERDLADTSTVGRRTEILTTPLSAETPRNFYSIVTPGFEEQAAIELRDWAPQIEFTTGRGGLELTLPLIEGCELNRVLKTPTRILVRLADYGCRDFPKLFKKMSGFPWQDWVSDETPLEFHATSKASRLALKKRIEETCLDGRKAFLKKRGAQPANPSLPSANVYVRFENDICWVSLDTSGEILHKRGLRPLSSNAPLRETMAANLLRYLEGFGSAADVELVDPMTGGGTFLMEAALMRKPVTSRPFAFERFTVRGSHAYLVQSSDPYTSFVGYEQDEKTLKAAAENLSGACGGRKVELHGVDFFKAPALAPGRERWLIVNPPYGERIRVEGQLSEFYERLFKACAEKVQPTRALFLLPEKVNPSRLQLPTSWKILGQKRFLNGGLPVVAMVYGPK